MQPRRKPTRKNQKQEVHGLEKSPRVPNARQHAEAAAEKKQLQPHTPHIRNKNKHVRFGERDRDRRGDRWCRGDRSRGDRSRGDRSRGEWSRGDRSRSRGERESERFRGDRSRRPPRPFGDPTGERLPLRPRPTATPPRGEGDSSPPCGDVRAGGGASAPAPSARAGEPPPPLPPPPAAGPGEPTGERLDAPSAGTATPSAVPPPGEPGGSDESRRGERLRAGGELRRPPSRPRSRLSRTSRPLRPESR